MRCFKAAVRKSICWTKLVLGFSFILVFISVSYLDRQDLNKSGGVADILGLAILAGFEEAQLLCAKNIKMIYRNRNRRLCERLYWPVEQETAHPHGGGIQPASSTASVGFTTCQEESREESEGERETGADLHCWWAESDTELEKCLTSYRGLR